MHLKVHLLLIGNGKVGLSCRHHLGGRRGIGRRDDIHVQPGILEVAELVGDDDGAVIRVHIPVENELQLVVGVSGGGSGESEAEQGGEGGLSHLRCLSMGVFSRAWPA